MVKLFGSVQKGDTIKIDGQRVKVESVRREANGDVNVRYAGKTIRGQESFRPDERAR